MPVRPTGVSLMGVSMRSMVSSVGFQLLLLMLVLAVGMLLSPELLAQIPTGIPTEVDAAVDDGYAFGGLAIRVIIGFLAFITVGKWVRAFFS